MTTSMEDLTSAEDPTGPQEQDGSDVAVREVHHPPATEGTSDRLLKDATARDWLGSNADPDVLLSVPHLGVDEITFELRDLRAHVNLDAQVLDLVKLNVGADVSLGEVNLRIAGVRAQAMLKVRLDNVVTIVDGVVRLLDNHPEIVTSLTSGLGDALREVGTGVGSGVHEIGAGAGDALRGIGTGLGNALDPAPDVEGRRTMSYHQAQQVGAEGGNALPLEPAGERPPVEAVTQTPLETIVQTPAETIVQTPTETVIQTPAETIVQTPAQNVEHPDPVEEATDRPRAGSPVAPEDDPRT
jgi:hypothetical protein